MRLAALAATAAGVLALVGTAARAAEVRVLSAGAVTPGLTRVVQLYQGRTGHIVKVALANGPEIQQRIGGGEAGFDVVVAPDAVLTVLAARLGGPATPLGRVGVAAAAKGEAPALADAEALKRAVLAASAVVISRGSTGVYLEGLFQRLRLTEALAGKLVREQNGAAVVERLLRGSGPEIGFAAHTELAAGRARGLRDRALPAEIQNATLYSAAAFPAAATRPEVAGLMALLAGPEGRAAMTASGIE